LRRDHPKELAKILELTNEDGGHPGTGLPDLVRGTLDEPIDGHHGLDNAHMSRRIPMDPVEDR
jgi:hypothetical protein